MASGTRLVGIVERFGCARVARVAQVGLGRVVDRALNDAGAQNVGAVLRVGVRLGTAKLMIDVKRTHVVAERSERVVQAGGVSTSRHERRDPCARLEQTERVRVRCDLALQLAGLHHGKISER